MNSIGSIIDTSTTTLVVAAVTLIVLIFVIKYIIDSYFKDKNDMDTGTVVGYSVGISVVLVALLLIIHKQWIYNRGRSAFLGTEDF